MLTRFLVIILLFCLNLSYGQQIPAREENGERLRHLAMLMERENRFDMAANYYIRALEVNRQDMASYMGAKRCLLNMGDLDKLEQLVVKLQKEKRDVQYSSDLAEIKYQRGYHKEAISHWKTLLDDHPKNHRVYHLVGNAYIEHRLFDLAVETFIKARETFESNQLFLFQLADIYALREEYDKMSQEYLSYLEANPNQYHFIESRFLNAATSDHAFNRIVNYLEDRKTWKNLKRYQLLSSLYIQAQAYDKALAALIPVEDSLKGDKQNGRLLFELARTASSDKEYEIAKRTFELLVERYEDSPFKIRAHFGLAEIHEHQENFELAISAFQDFIDQHSNSVEAIKAQMRIGDLWLEKKFNVRKAADAYDKVIQNWRQTTLRAQAELKLASCFTIQGEFKKAEQIYHRILEETPPPQLVSTNQAVYELGLLDFYQGRIHNAKARFEQIVAKPSIEKSDNPVNDAIELLMLLTENSQDSLALVDYGQARWKIRSRDYVAADSILDSASENATSLQENIWLLKSQLYDQTRQYTKGIAVLQKIVDLESAMYADLALKRQAEFYEKLGDFERAMDLLEQFLEKYPSSIYIESARRQIRTLRQVI
ncbi:tetratricopeptide repeat protein [candidate division KSB1 bacterium]|nr:tetratricopeptide repeat protein [candidate division KSB1 bacterium]